MYHDLLWECKNKHKFSLSHYQAKSKNRWCPDCVESGQDTLDIVRKAFLYAKKHNGKYVSRIHNPNKALPFTWKCHRGHIWRTNESIFQEDSWCSSCSLFEDIIIDDVDLMEISELLQQ
jgi:hypothetical protein